MRFNIEKLSDEEIDLYRELLAQEDTTRKVRKTLPESDELKKVNQAIKKAAKDLGVEADEIRLAEMSTFVENFPGFVVQANNKLEQWKSENATYTDPDNPENYWYSPDGSGNAPQWIRDVAGEKPKKEKNDKGGKYEKEFAAWLKKIERFAVKTEDKKEAA